MANPEHVKKLRQGVTVWNQWRKDHPEVCPDLSGEETSFWGANLSKANLSGANLTKAFFYQAILTRADLRGADLSEAMLREANLRRADLRNANLCVTKLIKANLSKANLNEAQLYKADLTEANLAKTTLVKANLNEANLYKAKCNAANFNEARLEESDLYLTNFRRAHLVKANLRRADASRAIFNDAFLNEADLVDASLFQTDFIGADLSNADLRYAHSVETSFANANLTGCSIHGISAWTVNLKGAKQSNLFLSRAGRLGKPAITVDNLEIAQFIYLILNHQKIRDLINTIGQKAVLILGRFNPPERKEILEAIANDLRGRGFIPIIFDFEKSQERDFTETIMTLAGLSLFVIVDLTNPKSSPLELQAAVPDYMIPFAPIIQKGEEPFSMFRDLQNKYDWILSPVIVYATKEELLDGLEDAVIKPALSKRAELVARKAEELKMKPIDEFLRK